MKDKNFNPLARLFLMIFMAVTGWMMVLGYYTAIVWLINRW